MRFFAASCAFLLLFAAASLPTAVHATFVACTGLDVGLVQGEGPDAVCVAPDGPATLESMLTGCNPGGGQCTNNGKCIAGTPVGVRVTFADTQGGEGRATIGCRDPDGSGYVELTHCEFVDGGTCDSELTDVPAEYDGWYGACGWNKQSGSANSADWTVKWECYDPPKPLDDHWPLEPS